LSTLASERQNAQGVVPFIGPRTLWSEVAHFDTPIDYIGMGSFAVMAYLDIKTGVNPTSQKDVVTRLSVLKSETSKLEIPRIYIANPVAHMLLKKGEALDDVLRIAGLTSMPRNTGYDFIRVGRAASHRALLGSQSDYVAQEHAAAYIEPGTHLIAIRDTSMEGTRVVADWGNAFARQAIFNREAHNSLGERVVSFESFGNSV
jgi:hypothetical protein